MSRSKFATQNTSKKTLRRFLLSAGTLAVATAAFSFASSSAVAATVTIEARATFSATTDGSSGGTPLSAGDDVILKLPASGVSLGDNGKLSMDASWSSFTGTITIGASGASSGGVNISATTALQSSVNIFVTESALLWAQTSMANNIELQGGATTTREAYGNLRLNGSVDISGTVTLTATSSVAVAATNVATISGNITGTGGLTLRVGTGAAASITLGGNNNYTGATTIMSAGGAGTGGAVILSGALTGTSGITFANNTVLNVTGSLGASGVYAGTINTTSGKLTLNQSANQTISGVISGSGSIEKSGAGTLILSGANTWTGVLTLSAGTLQVGDGGSTGAIGAVTFSSASENMVINRSGTLALTGAITGAGAISLQGITSLTATSDVFQDYTGNLTTAAGTTLGGSFSLSTGTTVVQGRLQPGGSGTVGSMNFNNLTIGGQVDFDLNAASTSSGNDVIYVSDTLTINSGTTIGLTFSGTVADGVTTRTYTLFSMDSLSTSIADLSTLLDSSWNEGRATYRIQSTGAYVNLVINGSSANLVWGGTAGGADDFNWISSNNATPTGPENWLNAGSADRFYTADAVTFDSTGKAGTILLNGELKPSAWVVDNNAGHDYVFASANDTPAADFVGGASSLVKSGAGKMTILTNNTFTGTVTINDGTVQIGDGTTGGKLGGTGTITLSDTATLAYNLPDTGTYALETLVDSRLISGGTFVKEGVGTMTISSNHNVLADQNATLVKDGTLELKSGGGRGMIRGTLTIDGANATVLSTATNSLGYSTNQKIDTVNILNGGTFTHTATGDIGWDTTYHLTGGTMETTHASGRFAMSSVGSVNVYASDTASTISGLIYLRTTGGQHVFSVEDGTVEEDLVVNAAIAMDTGQGVTNAGITKSGDGTMVINGAISYTGATSVTGGLLKVTGANTATGAWSASGNSQIWLTQNASTSSLNVASGSVLSLSQGTAFTDTASMGTVTLTGTGTSSIGHLKNMASAPTYDVVGSVTVNSGHTLSVGNSSDVEVLSIAGSLTLNTAKLQFTIGAGNNHDTIAASSVTHSGTNTVNLYLASGVITSGEYELITLVDGTGLTAGELLTSWTSNLGAGSGASFEVGADGKTIKLIVTNGNSLLIWNGAEGSSTWNTTAGNTNWLDSSASAAAFAQGDAVRFSGGGSSNVSIGVAVTPTLITIDGGSYTFANGSGGKISGSAGLRVENASLSISGANDFTGVVEILTGSTVELTGAGILANAGSASTLGAATADASNLVIDGGLLQFNGSASVVTNRSFTIGEGGATLSAIAMVTQFTSTGNIAHTGTGDRTLELHSELASGANIDSGGTHSIGGVLLLSLTDPEDGQLRVIKTGAGVWTLRSTTSTHTGGTEINGGLLGITNDRALGAVPTSFDEQNLVMNGGYLTNMVNTSTGVITNIFTSGTSFTLHANRGIYLDHGGGGIRIGYSGTSVTIDGAVSGPGSFRKWDTGTLRLNGYNTFSGGLTIDAGTVQAGHSYALGTGVVKVSSTLELMGVDVYVSALDESGAGTIQNGAGSIANTLYLGSSGDDFEFKGTILNGVGTLGITKLGSGKTTLALVGSTNYSGPVTVEDGLLKMSGSLSLGAVTNFTVNGGTLDLYGNSLDATKKVTIAGDGYLDYNTTTEGSFYHGALSNAGSGSAGISVALIVLSDSARIGSAQPFTFGTTSSAVTGVGNLTLAEIPIEGSGDGNGNFILNTGGRITLTASLSDPDSGQLIVETNMTANTNTAGAINAAGGVAISDGGNLFLSSSSNTTIITSSNVVTVNSGGLLTLSANTSQVLQTLLSDATAGASAGTVTHTGTGSGTLIIDSATNSTYGGRFGTSNVTGTTGDGAVNLTKRGTGTFTLSNETSDYTGTTRVSGGVLALAGVLTSDTDPATGVLGSTSETAASKLVIDGGILRDTSSALSTTEKLFTIGINGATIESSGSANTSGLQFLNTGAIAFEGAVMNAMLTLGGTRAFSSPTVTGVNKITSAITDNAAMAGTTTLRKTGTGMWVLDGANNTYTGETQIQNGTLALGVDNAVSTASQVVLGDGATSGVLYLNGYAQTVSGLSTSGTGTANRVIGGSTTLSTLTVNIATDATYAGALGGGSISNANNLELVKNGTATLTLSGTAAYTGDTKINAGTLALAGTVTSLASTTTLVADGAKLDVSALSNGITIAENQYLAAGNSTATDAISGKVTLSGGTLHIGDTDTSSGNVALGASSAATLQIDGTLTTAAGKDSVIKYTFSESVTGANDLLVADTLSFGGNTVIDATLSGGRLEIGTYTLATYGTLTSGITNLDASLLNVDTRYTVTLRNDTATNSIVMDVARSGTASDVLYWLGSPNTQWGDPANTGANFETEGAVGNVSYGSGDHAIFDDRVTDAAKRNVTVAAGGVTIGNITFENSAGFDYTVSGGAINGTGTIEKFGDGKLTLNNANTYTGGTFLGAGILAVGNNAALGTGTLHLQGGTLQASGGARTLANTFNVVTGTTSTINTATGEIAHSGALTGGGTLEKTGSADLRFSGNGGAFTGTIKNNQGDIAFDAAVNHSGAQYELAANARLVGAVAGNAVIQIGALSGVASSAVTSSTTGTKTFQIGSTTDSTFAGTITDGTGVVALTKTGTSTFTLTGNTNTYTGVTTVNGGVLEIGNGGTTGSLGTGAIQLNTGGTLAYNRSNAVTLAQAVTGAGTLEQRGSGVLTVTANNASLTGKVLVTSGTLQIGDGSQNYAQANVGTATIENNATLIYNLIGDYTVTSTITGHGDILKQQPGTLTYTGNNYNTGTVTIDQGGTLVIGDGTATTDQTFASSQIRLANADLVLNPGSGTNLTIGGGVTGSGNVTKTGDGTAILVGRTTTSGTITIDSGELHIGDGGSTGSVENSNIVIHTSAALVFNRTGTVLISSRISGTGDIRVLGGNSGNGTVVLTQDNLVTGTVFVENNSTLQIGDGGRSGSLNYDNEQVKVDVADGATLAWNRTGTNLVTGSNLTIEGAGNFEKLGTGTLTFNSDGQHTGATIVSDGRLIIETTNLPTAFTDPNGTGSLQANGNGVLELRNGTTPFDFEGRISGTGTIALGASTSVAAGDFTQYNYNLATSGATATSLTLQVESKANLYLGTNASTQVKVGTLNVLTGGKLSGQGTVTGDLQNSGTLWIGEETKTAAAQLTVTGNFINNGRVDVAIFSNGDGTYSVDSIHYAGSAQINSGSTVYFDITDLGGVLPENGTRIDFMFDDDTANNPLGSSITGSFVSINPEISNETLIYNNGEGFTLLFAKSIGEIPGLSLREGSGDFVRYLDDVRLGDTANPALAAISDLLADENQSRAINNASPAGLASMTSMPIAMAHDAAATLRSHLESLRYERAEIDVQPYIVATGSFARNGSGMSNPAFDYNTYGGLVGLDHSLSPELLVGINAGFHHGTADLNDGGGKVKLDNARITAYGTYKFSDWVYVDAMFFGGYNSYDVNHHSTNGNATADTTGYDYGVNVYIGTIVPVSQNVHFTPYAGLEFVRSEVDGFTEKGTNAALRIDSFTQDSLRAKIGTGVNWLVPTGGDFSLRLALDVAYAYEILDTEADIAGRFANDTSSAKKFKVNAASTPEHSIMAGPMVEFGFGGNKSLSLSYSLEYDLEDQYIHHLNATFRMRF